MSDDTVFRLRDEGLAAQSLDEEIVVLDLRSSTYLLLNATGAILWPPLQTGATMPALARVLVDEFAIDDADALRDATTFVTELQRLGLLDA